MIKINYLFMICARGNVAVSVCVCPWEETPGIWPSAYILMNLYSANIIFTVNEAESLKKEH